MELVIFARFNKKITVNVFSVFRLNDDAANYLHRNFYFFFF